MYKWIQVLCGILLSLILFQGTFHFFSKSESYYYRQYIKLQVHEDIGISKEDLYQVNHAMHRFLFHGEDTLHVTVTLKDEVIPFFNEKEILHLEDIVFLFQRSSQILYLLIILLLVLILISYKKAKESFSLVTMIKAAGFTAAVLLVFLAIVGLTDFKKAFFIFHEILFTNDLWLLNPRTDRLIVMMPLPFFIGFTVHWLLTVFIIHGLLIISPYCLSKTLSRVGHFHKFFRK